MIGRVLVQGKCEKIVGTFRRRGERGRRKRRRRMNIFRSSGSSVLHLLYLHPSGAAWTDTQVPRTIVCPIRDT